MAKNRRIINGALDAEFMRTLKMLLNHPAGLIVK
jgi:pyruvate/2-oxoglutarate dehydrogenase complex dihydrolipoamide acyltransferase (E2) component